MRIPLRLPLLLLVLGLFVPGCVHLHPDFMPHGGDGDFDFRHPDDDGDDDDDGDRDGLERHIRDLEETLQHLEQEMDEVHQELDEAHREMNRRHERNDDDREEHRRDDDRRDEDREEHRRDDDRRDEDRGEHRRDDDRHDEDRGEHRRDDDRRDEDRGEHRRDEDRRDEDREEHRRDDDRRDEDREEHRRDDDRDRDFHPRDDGPDGERRRVERFESNGELPMGDFKFGRTGVRAFQVGIPGNRGPEGRRIGQRDQRPRDGGGLGAENRNRRNDRDRARGRQMRPQQRPGGDPRALPSRNREGRGNEQDRNRDDRNRDDRNRDDRNRGDRNRGNNDQDQQQIHWSGSLEEMPDHILEMLKNLDVDIPFDRAGDGESHVEIEVIHSENSDGPEGDNHVRRRYVEVDTGKTFEFNLGNAVRGAPVIPGESVEWIGDHSMPREVHIIRVGSDLPPDWKKVSNKKASNKKASNKKVSNKKAINKKKAAARKKAAVKKKSGNKKTGKQKADKKSVAPQPPIRTKKAGEKKTDKKKTDKKKAVEVESGATFKFVVGGLDGIESKVTFGSTDGIDPDQQSIHYESLEEMPDHIREMIESLDMVDVEKLLGDLDEVPADIEIMLGGHGLPDGQQEDSSKKKVAVEKKTNKKKSDKKKDNKETDKKKDDVTLEGRIVL